MSDKIPTLTEAYQQGRDDERRNWLTDGSTHYEGCEVYHPRCEARMLRNVLTGLIAELRSEWVAFTAGDGRKSLRRKDDGWVTAAADRAEARLREVFGGE